MMAMYAAMLQSMTGGTGTPVGSIAPPLVNAGQGVFPGLGLPAAQHPVPFTTPNPAQFLVPSTYFSMAPQQSTAQREQLNNTPYFQMAPQQSTAQQEQLNNAPNN